MLYKFDKLSNKMDEWGFPKLQSKSGFELIRTDFENAYKSGNIRFGDDGVYLVHEGRELRGYMFIKEAYITYEGRGEKFPKFHLIKCKIIQDFINNGNFKQRYEWSNSDTNDLIDKQTRIEYKDIKLNLCGFCRKEILDPIETTEDFFNTLDTDEIEDTSLEIDIFGYARNWQKISKEYRKRMDYTCEECGIRLGSRSEHRYLHTHHKNGDKTNNNIANLQSLCILCHSYENTRHEENFDKKRLRNEVKSFIKKFRDVLIEVGNVHLDRFEKENSE